MKNRNLTEIEELNIIQAVLEDLAARDIVTTLRVNNCSGIQSEPTECPIARYVMKTTGICAEFGPWLFNVLDSDHTFHVPSEIGDFIANFDFGNIPELVVGEVQ